jgi:hypothetical protein
MISCWPRSILATAVFLLAPLADQAHACSCPRPGPPCQAAWTADVVFSGIVRSIEPIEGDRPDQPFQPVRVKFDVDRGYLNAPSGVVEVATGGGNCGYGFAAGKRYLVYASKQPPSGLSTSICSRTRPIEEADEDIKYLSSIPAKSTGARVYGRLNEWRRDPAEEHGVDYGPLEGVTVSVRGSTFQKDAVTDAHGLFEVANLPVGKATIAVLAPFGFDTRSLTYDIDITDRRACSLQNFTLALTARASGTVVDASGHPVAGVQVDAVAAELAGFDPPPHQSPATTNERGIFEFDNLPPGTYVFGVNLTKAVRVPRSGPTVFLPGVGVARDATVIELKAGDERAVGVVRLPSR